MLPAWFEHPEESFSYKEVQFKIQKVLPACKNQLPYAFLVKMLVKSMNLMLVEHYDFLPFFPSV